ncbi:MAG: tetratricopeptide repeat protein [Chitinophagales bacterium]
MKKVIYFLCIAVWISSAACSRQHTGAETIPAITDTRTVSGSPEESEKLLDAYDNAVAQIQSDPNLIKPYLTLANVFVMQSRLTGNNSYYDAAALQMCDHVIDRADGNNDLLFEAYTIESGVFMSMHQFTAALDVAQKAYAISQHNAQLLGALVDAHVELGQYTEAVKYADDMVNLRPDIRSYSRISYLRQIYGDNAGAIEAMKMAVESGVPGAESTEWARVTLGDLLLLTGDLQHAEECFTLALNLRENYPYAEAGLGRLEKAKKNYPAAIEHTENAIRIMSHVSFVEQLADLYALNGDAQKAKEIRRDVLSELLKGEKQQKNMDRIGHNANRELALAYMQLEKYDQAMEYAQKDLAMRPDNIDANELAAWIAYLQDNIADAQKYADKMLATNTQNPNTLYKAMCIYVKAKQTEKIALIQQQYNTACVDISLRSSVH